jgi:hypothetical protein
MNRKQLVQTAFKVVKPVKVAVTIIEHCQYETTFKGFRILNTVILYKLACDTGFSVIAICETLGVARIIVRHDYEPCMTPIQLSNGEERALGEAGRALEQELRERTGDGTTGWSGE